MITTLIGIDCATLEKKTGLAWGIYNGRSLRVESVTLGTAQTPVIETVLGWMDSAPNPESILIAIDAPLGWPAQLGQKLHHHNAGDPIEIEPNKIFRRETDRFIKQKICKQPLDVGADRIARTAHKALEILGEIRTRAGVQLPLAWTPKKPHQPAAIEVYPAATLLAHGLEIKGYKGLQGSKVRAALLAELSNQVDLPVDHSLMVDKDDPFDAFVCLLAGADFLRDEVYMPRDLDLAKREGWIWVKRMGN
jgi:predicted RNase H-like nuclease